ncbi:hypothetical protein NBRGN_004_00900 [Nocardia brasiliensis NBRC 14402]|uniref:hypothetical protein n=1 Tax=Nocardia brasiliensis TaxID=37326 RepID=UPI00031109E6|nr:hypothetical protein [Nocardia brasiliensis]GAJ79227.1 hypothetical protein NBRGN_004_00900 [Nocardia brasiliensis NBRC 14402]SUB53126.1 Uncharacterised protein [Nocardia brasiliensis]
MGKSRRERTEHAAPDRPASTLDLGAAEKALTKLLFDPSAQSSFAGAYAAGYAAVGVAQIHDDGPSWFHETDPLDLIVLGCAYPKVFSGPDEFGNARTAWLHLIRDTPLWAGIQYLIDAAVRLTNLHGLPIDDGSILLALCASLNDGGLDKLEIPEDLRLENALADARFVRGGPMADYTLPTASEHAHQQAVRFMGNLGPSSAGDNTCAEYIRDGLYLLELAGLPVHAESWVLLVALFVSLTASDEEPIDELSDRAGAWALGLDDSAPLTAVVDAIMFAAEQGIEPTATLGHLYALPQFTAVVDPESRRWHSEPGTDFIPLAFEFGHKQVRTRFGRTVRVDPDLKEALRALEDSFREKFGRDPNPDDPVLFDPDQAMPTPISETALSDIWQSIADNTTDRRISAFVLAAKEVGYLVTEDNEELFSQDEREAFYEAVDFQLRLQDMSPLESTSLVLRQIIQGILDGSADWQAPRRFIQHVVDADESDSDFGPSLVELLILTPIAWLNHLKRRGVSEWDLREAVNWLDKEHGGSEVCGAAAAIATIFWSTANVSKLEEHLGKRSTNFTLNDLHDLFDIDLMPAIIWLCAGLTATTGNGKISWLDKSISVRKPKRARKTKSKPRKRKGKPKKQ